MADDKPQYLKHTEAFVRTRRNYMLSVVTLIVLAAANPSTITIPGLGNEAILPAQLAFAALWAATTFFGIEYAVERSFVSTDNSKAIEKSQAADKALLDQLQRSIDQIRNEALSASSLSSIKSAVIDDKWAEKLDAQMVQAIVGSLHAIVRQAEMIMIGSAEPGKVNKDIFEDKRQGLSDFIDGKIKEHVGIYESERTQIGMKINTLSGEVASNMPTISAKLDVVADELSRLTRTYTKVSNRVHYTLRYSFSLKDTWLAVILYVSATAMLFVPFNGYTWKWQSWMPQSPSQDSRP